MKKMTELRIQVFFLMLILVLASLACHLPGSDLWVDVDDKGDVYVEEHGKITILATADTENELPELPLENEGKNDGSLAGTYTGEFYYNEDHADNDELMENEINVHISNSGIVDGSANFQFNWTHITNNPELCTHYFEKGTSYIISGQINGVDRETVEVQKSTYQIIEHSPCGEYERSDEECSCEGVLTVSDGELKIRCGSDSNCGVVLFAKK